MVRLLHYFTRSLYAQCLPAWYDRCAPLSLYVDPLYLLYLPLAFYDYESTHCTLMNLLYEVVATSALRPPPCTSGNPCTLAPPYPSSSSYLTRTSAPPHLLTSPVPPYLFRYDYDQTDVEWSSLAAAGRQRPWRARRERAFFRGSVYWYRRHGRTRAFAQSMATPHEIDADWCAQRIVRTRSKHVHI